MNTASTSWDPSRWRDSDHQSLLYPKRPNAAADLGAAGAGDAAGVHGSPYHHPPPHHDFVHHHHDHHHDGHSDKPQHHPGHEHHPHWQHVSRAAPDAKPRALPPLTESYTDASSFQARHHSHQSPASPPAGGDVHRDASALHYSPTTPPAAAFAPASWRGLPPRDSHQQQQRLHDHHHQQPRPGPIADAPLTLQIPQSLQETPRGLAPAYAATTYSQPHAALPHPSLQPSARSLPSFATLQEKTNRSEDADDGPEIAPMSSRLSCYMCIKLRPVVEQVALAVAELDCQIQSTLQRPINRSLDYPKTNAARTLEWILDRLRHAKGELQGPGLPSDEVGHHQRGVIVDMASHNNSPPTSLKRSLEFGDAEDFPVLKRPRSGGSVEQSRTLLTPGTRDDYRSAYDFATRDAAASGRSPPATESIPPSAFPRPPSPSIAGRSARPLPSPISLAFPPSVAPSLPTLPGQSVASPATSYHPPSSIHTASTSSATSQHIADLQHQVTLKSLALQTLQSEYSTLLQKFQRERVKSQAIEKKTTVADQEVNELSTKNDELTEQVRNLEHQLELAEKKRESEREAAGREKEQWSRMLDMSSRLQAKGAEELQKTRDERAHLLEQINTLNQLQQRGSTPPTGHSDPDEQQPRKSSSDGPATLSAGGSGSGVPSGRAIGGVLSLNREIGRLQARNAALEQALVEIRQQIYRMQTKAQELADEERSLREVVDKALSEETTAGAKTVRPTLPPAGELQPLPQEIHVPGASHQQRPQESGGRSGYSKSKSPRSPGFYRPPRVTSIPSAAELAAAARATSPGPAEMGLNILPSTSSPEELIQALGPVPSRADILPLSSMPSSASTTTAATSYNATSIRGWPPYPSSSSSSPPSSS